VGSLQSGDNPVMISREEQQTQQ